MDSYQDYTFPDSALSHAHQYLLPALMPMLQRENKILDLGCGNGALSIELIKAGFDVFGIDASEEGISQKLPPELRNASFSTLISTEVIEHLYDPKGFIRFCKQILSNTKNGELIISTPYHGYFKNLVLSLFNKWDDHLDPNWSGGHIKFWSRATLSQLLMNEGFEVIRFKGCGRFPYFWKSMVLQARLK
jgi:2-polyprenyl-3-methyl-5-hydroxy-6-metoxy-1,4-benzoquinol methylase